jgi:hypothetical protein
VRELTGGHGRRRRSRPIFVVVTDEGPITGSDTLHCPDSTTVTDAAKAIGAKIIGIYGDLPPGSTAVADLTTLATATGAVDSSNAAAPMVYSGSGSGADDAIVAALQTARTSMPLEDVHAVVVDVEGDAVDVATFVDRVEVAADFDEEACEQGLETSDQTPDGFDDTYDSVPGSSVLCWRIVAAGNTDVPGDVAARNYPGTLRVLSGNAILQELPLLFIVPPG